MKAFALLGIISLMLISKGTEAQIRKIPSEATEALKAKYPDARNVSWSDKITSFNADFELGNEKYHSKFNSKGELQATRKEMTKDNLPAAVKDGLSKSKYADWEIKAVSALYLPAGLTQYIVVSQKTGLPKKNLLFNEEGRLLKDNTTL